ncbi:MAG: zinc-binding protein [Candidatus Melainabacteria bacterium RIFOXYA12_FULL_32_12]|nr:MAG: zinc-binding protein [Candidatus Melainabacteria bacterium RIFOXYA2_FULL_32_9]OGI30520.1 MAG: zinc-binding protein [Candidatus Melainabacteria bacterium RIFOXYA12_FULL_32_12]
MTYQDKILQCADCGYDFEFTSNEQAFYASKGLTNHPKRCKSCRNARKDSSRYGVRSENNSRKMYDVVCSDCGADAQVPFQPSGNRPVLCKNCYSNSYSRRSA